MRKFEACTYVISDTDQPLRDDRINLPLTLLMAKLCQSIFEERALKAKTFVAQGLEREMAEYFGAAIAGYHNTRNEYEASKKAKEGE